MYREEGERGYKCVFGGREGVLTGSFGGSDRSGGHHRVGIGVVGTGGPRRVCQSEWPCLGSFQCPFHLQAGGSFLFGYLWASHRDTFP